jgi:hypothetical protein
MNHRKGGAASGPPKISAKRNIRTRPCGTLGGAEEIWALGSILQDVIEKV